MKYYFSQGEGASGAMVYRGYDYVDALAVNQTNDEIAAYSILDKFGLGKWTVWAMPDAANELVEEDENNNNAWASFTISLDTGDNGLPDLGAAMTVSPEGAVIAGGRKTVDMDFTFTEGTLKKCGDGAALCSFKVRFYLGTQSAPSGTDVFLNEIKSLTPGNYTRSISLRIPPTTAFGDAYIIAQVDATNAIEESFESNNVVSSAVQISGRVDSKDKRVATGLPESIARSSVCPFKVAPDARLYNKRSLGFWNLLHLGYENSKDWESMGCVAAHFDVLALIEVENEKGVTDLAAAAAKVTDTEWGHHMSPYEVGTATGKEWYAFIYNKDTSSFLNGVGFFNDTDDVIKREPYAARFRIGNFDFSLLAFHQHHGGNIATPRGEALHSGDIFVDIQSRNCSEEKDLFFGGDMNLPSNDEHWALLTDERYAYLKATSTVDAEQGTTISKVQQSLLNSYDNVFYSTVSTTEDEVEEAGAFDFTLPGQHEYLYGAVSDHIPAYVILNDKVMTQSDDDTDNLTC